MHATLTRFRSLLEPRGHIRIWLHQLPLLPLNRPLFFVELKPGAPFFLGSLEEIRRRRRGSQDFLPRLAVVLLLLFCIGVLRWTEMTFVERQNKIDRWWCCCRISNAMRPVINSGLDQLLIDIRVGRTWCLSGLCFKNSCPDVYLWF